MLELMDIKRSESMHIKLDNILNIFCSIQLS